MKWLFRITVLLLALVLTTACNKNKLSKKKDFDLVGAWELVRIEHVDGRIDTLDMSRYTRCKIYNADSIYYSIELFTDGEQVHIVPHEMAHYTFNDHIYIENGRVTPFQIINDTTITTVWDGYLEVFQKATTMTEARKKEICDIVRMYRGPDIKTDRLTHFVRSTSERKLQLTNQRLLFIVAILILLSVIIGWYIFQTLKHKRKLEQQLGELQKARSFRPQSVTNAMKEVEAAFFKSEYYFNLRKKIEAGNNLNPTEWKELEMKLKEVYPDFSTALYQIHSLSTIEYRVCLLTKVHANPTEIAGVLKREPSSISSMRGRLYHKVFDGKGGAREWDEFILSL